jgi:glucose-1-phosphate thymidylyltransferase
MVRGPVHIAAGAYLEDSYIGPYTAIGPNTRVYRSEVEYSILMGEVEIRDLPYRLDASVIGQGGMAEGKQADVRRHTLQLVLGDRSQVKL